MWGASTTVPMGGFAYHVALGDWTQVVRCGSKSLKQQSHLTSLSERKLTLEKRAFATFPNYSRVFQTIKPTNCNT